MRKLNLPSVANISPDFLIGDPAAYLKQVRSSILKDIREEKGLQKDSVARKLSINIADLDRMESGHVSEKDLSSLYKLSGLYEVEYNNLLVVFKLAKHQTESYQEKIAAYHNPNSSEEAKAAITEFLTKIKGGI